MVNKAELTAEVAERLKDADADARQYVDAVFDAIMRHVAAGERVQILGFGTFDSVTRAARTGRNPRTGAAIQVAAGVAPRFHAGQTFRAQVTDGKTVTAAVAEVEQAPAKPAKAKKVKAAEKKPAKVVAEKPAKVVAEKPAEVVAEKPAKVVAEKAAKVVAEKAAVVAEKLAKPAKSAEKKPAKTEDKKVAKAAEKDKKPAKSLKTVKVSAKKAAKAGKK